MTKFHTVSTLLINFRSNYVRVHDWQNIFFVKWAKLSGISVFWTLFLADESTKVCVKSISSPLIMWSFLKIQYFEIIKIVLRKRMSCFKLTWKVVMVICDDCRPMMVVGHEAFQLESFKSLILGKFWYTHFTSEILAFENYTSNKSIFVFDFDLQFYGHQSQCYFNSPYWLISWKWARPFTWKTHPWTNNEYVGSYFLVPKSVWRSSSHV